MEWKNAAVIGRGSSRVIPLVAKALTGAGFAVDIAPDGLAADHLLLNERYALVVLDVALPRLNGWICWPACASAARPAGVAVDRQN